MRARPAAAEWEVPEAGTPAQGKAGLHRIAVLIPAWQPEPVLLDVVAELLRRGVQHVLVVDDGSDESASPIFAALAHTPGVEVLHHKKNGGKGRALKTGFAHLLHSAPDLLGVVTADADGQHTPEDIVRVAGRLASCPGRPVLGSRAFSGGVPLRSRFGNAATRHLFRLLTGVWLADTQTGLRGLPVSLLARLVDLEGERYEYEMRMLAHLCREGARPVELPVATVYLENNRGSHFHPVWDSLRVYTVLMVSAMGGKPLRTQKHATLSVRKSAV